MGLCRGRCKVYGSCSGDIHCPRSACVRSYLPLIGIGYDSRTCSRNSGILRIIPGPGCSCLKAAHLNGSAKARYHSIDRCIIDCRNTDRHDHRNGILLTIVTLPGQAIGSIPIRNRYKGQFTDIVYANFNRAGNR